MSSWHSGEGLFIATRKMAGEGLGTPEPAVTEKQIAEPNPPPAFAE